MNTPEAGKNARSETMKVCPRCYDNNPINATECRQCGLALGTMTGNVPHLCPAGLHVMDPSWKVCVFCKTDGTVAESASMRSETTYETAAGRPRRTVVETDSRYSSSTLGETAGAGTAQSAPVAAKRTRYDSGASQAGNVAPSAARRIVAILITYTWQPEGQVFPVREGRNLIGRDPQQADIAVPQDDTLSAVNSHITFRKSFVIGDQVSMGGTDVNGEPVEQQFHPLPNYSRIRTGSTIWTFIAISPPGEAAAE
jgi:ribosomal protein L40E